MYLDVCRLFVHAHEHMQANAIECNKETTKNNSLQNTSILYAVNERSTQPQDTSTATPHKPEQQQLNNDGHLSLLTPLPAPRQGGFVVTIRYVCAGAFVIVFSLALSVNPW